MPIPSEQKTHVSCFAVEKKKAVEVVIEALTREIDIEITYDAQEIMKGVGEGKASIWLNGRTEDIEALKQKCNV